MTWRLEIYISDATLEELPSTAFNLFYYTDMQGKLKFLGFDSYHGWTIEHRPRECDTVIILRTDEVTKPELFGKPLPYTAERV